jgi:predicted enzyme related to lactoylglutathione lyase
MPSFYPTLVSDKLVSTINFYEDFFGFVPTVEKDGYALLQDRENPERGIAVFDASHTCVAALDQSVKGVIITLAVDDIETTYNDLYMEGLELYKEFGTDINGSRHFVVYDPNGILVNVTEGQKLAA